MFRFLKILIWKVICEIIKALSRKRSFVPTLFHRDHFQESTLFDEPLIT